MYQKNLTKANTNRSTKNTATTKKDNDTPQTKAYESYEVAMDKIDIYTDQVPMTSCVVQFMQNQASTKPYIILFDSGSSHSWWNHKSIPKGCTPKKVEATNSQTLAGNMNSSLEIQLENVTFPEFFKTRKVGEITARLFTAKCRYDAIIGRDKLTKLGLVLDFKTQKISWDNFHVPMRPFPSKETKNTVLAQRPEPTPAERLYLNML